MKKGLALCRLCAFWHDVLFELLHAFGRTCSLYIYIYILHASVMHFWAYFMHAQGMQTVLLCLLPFCRQLVRILQQLGKRFACTRHANCIVLLACILHACSMNCAACRANTIRAKSMQLACCIVLGLFCVSFVCNAYCALFCSVPSVCILTCSSVWSSFPALVMMCCLLFRGCCILGNQSD